MTDVAPETAPNWRLRAVVGVFAALCVVGLAVLAYRLIQPTHYRLVLTTGSSGGTYLPLGKGIAKVIHDAYPHIDVEVLESSGAVENMSRLERDEADLAFVQNDTRGPASVRTIIPLYREVLHFLVWNGSTIRSFREVRGKRIAVGERGSGTEALVHALLRHFNLEYGDFEPVFVGASEATDLIIKGEIEAMLFVGGMKSAACQRAVASGQVRFIGIGTPGVDAGEIEGFRFEYPFAEPYIIPLLTYGSPTGGMPQRPIATIAIRAVLVAQSNVPSEAIRQVTSAVFSSRTELIRTHATAVEIRERFDDTFLQYPVHSGAQAYYRRDEPGFLVTYAELMGFMLSLVVFLMAAFAGIREWIRLRKKNRIDVYYTRLDQILTELRAEDVDMSRLDSLEEELGEMQRRAFKQLVDEQLRADESFRIFQDFLAECKSQIADLRKPGS
jgi:TRAP transporter TAXI family solute receptor